MDTTLARLDLHSASICPLKVLLLIATLNPPCMLWNVVYEAGSCVPSLCLKYLVLCLANALLATGWLLASILSILGELIPRAFGVPPTMPKFSPPIQHEASPLSRSKRRPGSRPQTRQSTVDQPVTQGKDAPQQVSPAAQDGSPSPPSSPDSRITDHGVPDRAHNSSVSPERPSPPVLSLPDSSADPLSSTSAEPARGRKLGFLRRHLSGGRSSPKRPILQRVTSVREIVTSPEHSPERSEKCTVKSCIKKCRSVESVRAPVPRTDPYQAPYFFPSPLSPDARDYMSRVRNERVSSPLTETKSRSTAPSSPEITRTPTSPPPQSPPKAQPDASSSQPTKTRPKVARRSWHISFRHDHQEALQRPPSWNSDTTTVVSAGSQPDASDASHPSSPDMSRRSPQRKQSPGRALSPLNSLELSPLDEHNSVPSTPSPAKLTPRKSWNFPFRHRRTTSDASTASVSTQHLSEHSVDELPKPRARPKIRKTA